jgi:hypothetical protein
LSPTQPEGDLGSGVLRFAIRQRRLIFGSGLGIYFQVVWKYLQYQSQDRKNMQLKYLENYVHRTTRFPQGMLQLNRIHAIEQPFTQKT